MIVFQIARSQPGSHSPSGRNSGDATWHGSCDASGSRTPFAPAVRRRKRMDALYLGLTVGFVALSWAFIVACERLG